MRAAVLREYRRDLSMAEVLRSEDGVVRRCRHAGRVPHARRASRTPVRISACPGSLSRPAWRFPSLLSPIESGRIDIAPLIARESALSEVGRELAACNGPTPPGVAVVTDFTR